MIFFNKHSQPSGQESNTVPVEYTAGVLTVYHLLQDFRNLSRWSNFRSVWI
jgi:hypothetical protein